MTGLRIAPNLQLPEEAVTETFAILAKRGKGKTNTAVVMAEEMIDAGLPVIVIDPVGVWWGLRSSADGKSEGLPVVIFGGDHADVPLEDSAGQLIADVLVDRRTSAVIDLSSFSKAAMRRFMAPFIERLYHRNRQALHVIVDEADAFAPQRAAGEGARLLGAMEDLVRRGRARGIGCTLITQRPAVLHKDVLTQAEVLIALGMTGPRDVAAIDEWVRLHADEDQAAELKKSLPALPVGTAWVWSPGWLDTLVKVQVRARRTFDSSATPKPGQTRQAPKRMADVDLAALGEQITATVEQAKADDPKTLRRRLAQAERELAAARAANTIPPPAAEPVIERIEVPALDAATQESLRSLAQTASTAIEQIHHVLSDLGVDTAPPPRRRTHATSRTGTTKQSTTTPADPGELHLKAGARRILETLARHHPLRVTKAQLGTLAKFKITGSTFQTYWSTLKRHGLIDETGGDIGLTQAGLDYVGTDVGDPLTTDQILQQWRDVLKAGARAMLDHLVAIHPADTTRDELADAVDMTATGGTFQTYLGTLRRNGLVDVEDGMVRASDALFMTGGAP